MAYCQSGHNLLLQLRDNSSAMRQKMHPMLLCVVQQRHIYILGEPQSDAAAYADGLLLQQGARYAWPWPVSRGRTLCGPHSLEVAKARGQTPTLENRHGPLWGLPFAHLD
eukprot:285841-Chlamydomonas_euryale.AAC.2